jgi:hypothetical protein
MATGRHPGHRPSTRPAPPAPAPPRPAAPPHHEAQRLAPSVPVRSGCTGRPITRPPSPDHADPPRRRATPRPRHPPRPPPIPEPARLPVPARPEIPTPAVVATRITGADTTSAGRIADRARAAARKPSPRPRTTDPTQLDGWPLPPPTLLSPRRSPHSRPRRPSSPAVLARAREVRRSTAPSTARDHARPAGRPAQGDLRPGRAGPGRAQTSAPTAPPENPRPSTATVREDEPGDRLDVERRARNTSFGHGPPRRATTSPSRTGTTAPRHPAAGRRPGRPPGLPGLAVPRQSRGGVCPAGAAGRHHRHHRGRHRPAAAENVDRVACRTG